jgi:hypothetical protein
VEELRNMYKVLIEKSEEKKPLKNGEKHEGS